MTYVILCKSTAALLWRFSINMHLYASAWVAAGKLVAFSLSRELRSRSAGEFDDNSRFERFKRNWRCDAQYKNARLVIHNLLRKSPCRGFMTFTLRANDKSGNDTFERENRARFSCERRAIFTISSELRKRVCSIVTSTRVFIESFEERKHGISAPPFLRVSAFPARRCDNHSARWTIIDRGLFTLAPTRPSLCVPCLQRFSEKAPVIDKVLTRKRLFSSPLARGYSADGNFY